MKLHRHPISLTKTPGICIKLTAHVLLKNCWIGCSFNSHLSSQNFPSVLTYSTCSSFPKPVFGSSYASSFRNNNNSSYLKELLWELDELSAQAFPHAGYSINVSFNVTAASHAAQDGYGPGKLPQTYSPSVLWNLRCLLKTKLAN